jgi:hypothetical protein
VERRLAVHAGPDSQALSWPVLDAGSAPTRSRLCGAWLAAVAAFAAVLLVAGAADARPKRRDARAAFDRGVVAYQKGNYVAASEALGKSYELEHDVDTLFAWAQAERRLDHCDKAMALYEQLLAFVLPPANRTAVEQKLAECKALMPAPPPSAPPPATSPSPAPPPSPAAAEALATPPSAPPPMVAQASLPPTADHPEAPVDAPAGRRWYKDPIALSLLGAGVVAGGVGAGFLVSAQTASKNSKNAGDYPTSQSEKHTAEQRGKIGLASTIAGGALVAGGVVWIVLHRGGEGRGEGRNEGRGVTGWLAPGGGGLAFGGPF